MQLREDFGLTIATAESGWSRRRIVLLARYEQIAWQLFAEGGFREVTVDEIAAAADVSARTLFRCFPTKDEFLIGVTRHGLQALVGLIAALEPSPDPVRSVWRLIRSHSIEQPQDVRLLTLWRRAAADAPEIQARVRGERVHALTDAVTDYCAKSKVGSGSDDPEPRLLAGVMLWGRSGLELPEIFAAAEAALLDLTQRRRAAGTP